MGPVGFQQFLTV